MWHDDASQDSMLTSPRTYNGQERRRSPRIQTPFPVIVRSGGSLESPFEEDTILDNFNNYGLHVRLLHRVQQGISLLVLLRCAVAPETTAMVAWIELHGIVVRTEAEAGGFFGTAIRLTYHRYIYTTAPLSCCSVAC